MRYKFTPLALVVSLLLVPISALADSPNYILPISPSDYSAITAHFDHTSPEYGSDSSPNLMTLFDGTTYSNGGSCGGGVYSGCYNGHNGNDFATGGVEGKDVLAAAKGVVKMVDWDDPGDHTSGYGFMVRLWHGGYGQSTIYGHTSSTQVVVSVNDQVSQGQRIAESGNTGNSTGPHLHFSVFNYDGYASSHSIDPYGWSGGGSDPWSIDQGYLWTTDPPSLSPYTTISGDITSNTTWKHGAYVINAARSVSSGVTLTIDPGAVIKFASSTSARLTINGVVNAQGNSNNRIFFTSFKDDQVGGDTNGDATSTSPAAGDWGTIELSSTSSTTLSNTVLRYGGGWDNSIIKQDGGSLAISNTEIATSTWGFEQTGGTSNISGSSIYHHTYGVRQWAGDATLYSNTIRDNTSYGVYVCAASICSSGSTPGGSLNLNTNYFLNNTNGPVFFEMGSGISFSHTGNTSDGSQRGYILEAALSPSWPGSDLTLTSSAGDLPYIIPAFSSPIVLPSGKKLTVQPGAVFKFGNYYSQMSLSGNLGIQGTTSTPVYFTSLKDDSVGGDTNGDGSSTSPAAADWGTIAVGGNATVTSAVIRYGGGYYNSALYQSGGTVNIINSEIATSTWGFEQAGGTSNISGSDIHNNNYGIYFEGSTASLTATSTKIHSNSTYGVYNSTTNNSVTAESNWWGASNGPSGSGPGSGDAVSAHVDYANWLTSAP